ncbi:MAG: hypothetical protein IJ415_02485 [Clostridia bacterium]|nr:hypothetical protein [Clostridia bacterium]
MINYNYIDNMADCVQNIESFSVFESGNIRVISKGNEVFNKILKNIEELFSTSRVMPAFGVSLHDETLNALKQDNWLQINFNEELEKNGLPFSSLLFKLEITSGMNLIRLYNGKYDGRCIYLDLNEPIDLNCILN